MNYVKVMIGSFRGFSRILGNGFSRVLGKVVKMSECKRLLALSVSSPRQVLPNLLQANIGYAIYHFDIKIRIFLNLRGT